MKDIIIAYPNKEVALRLRALLVGEGLRVSHICALGSSALGAAGEKDAGVSSVPLCCGIWVPVLWQSSCLRTLMW